MYDSLNGKIKYLSLTDTKFIWTPDIFFVNEKAGTRHDVLSDNIVLRIKPNGDIFYSMKVSVTLTCPMNLKKYPFDNQICEMRLTSYGYTVDELILDWKEGNRSIWTNPAVRSLEKFSLRGFNTNMCSEVSTRNPLYSCIVASFEFERNSSWCLIHVFCPTTFFVVLSYLSLWLDDRSTRYLLAIGSLLFQAIFITMVNVSSLPKTTFSKPVDVWTGVCLTMSFACLLVLVGVEKYSKYLTIVTEETEMQQIPKANDSEATESQKQVASYTTKTRLQLLDKQKLEDALLALLPMIFLAFVIIFCIAFGRRQQLLQTSYYF